MISFFIDLSRATEKLPGLLCGLKLSGRRRK
uniref:Uncharacterized protein n=1 Tax=Anguilla anguilla TaxID=7936 RepID=A0A0E9PSP6_ANGAN